MHRRNVATATLHSARSTYTMINDKAKTRAGIAVLSELQ